MAQFFVHLICENVIHVMSDDDVTLVGGRGGGRNNKKQRPNKTRQDKGKHTRPMSHSRSRLEQSYTMKDLARIDSREVLKILGSLQTFKVNDRTSVCEDANADVAIDASDPKEVVKKECSGNFDPQSGKKCGRQGRCFKTVIHKEGFQTIKQQMDGVATKTYVRQHLVDRKKFFGFLGPFNAAASNVLKQLCITRKLQYGKDVVFAFKGGNVMQLILGNTFDGASETELRKEWDEIMQIGDMDFEVFIEDANDRMLKDVTVLMLFVLYSFRVFLQEKGWLITPDDESLTAIMEIVPRATVLTCEGHKAHTEDNIITPYTMTHGCDLLYTPVRSVLMHGYSRGSEARSRWLETGVKSDTPLSVSMNRSVSFGIIQKLGVAPDADIILLRLKHGMHVGVDEKCGRKASAEVIDVSIPTNLDRMHTLKGGGVGVNWFSLYRFSHDGEVLEIHAPSMENFVLDLQMFMFVLSEYPWFDPKHSKRMKRYAWFCTMLRGSQGATSQEIATELGSLVRVLSKLIDTTLHPGDGKPERSVVSSLARQVSPWSEMITCIEDLRSKAHQNNIITDWLKFVGDMCKILKAVMTSFTTLNKLKIESFVHSTASKKRPLVSSSTTAHARASLAVAALSASANFSKALVHQPLPT